VTEDTFLGLIPLAGERDDAEIFKFGILSSDVSSKKKRKLILYSSTKVEVKIWVSTILKTFKQKPIAPLPPHRRANESGDDEETKAAGEQEIKISLVNALVDGKSKMKPLLKQSEALSTETEVSKSKFYRVRSRAGVVTFRADGMSQQSARQTIKLPSSYLRTQVDQVGREAEHFRESVKALSQR